MIHGPPPVARLRAEAALRADPARSNPIIAIQAQCTSQHVRRSRRALEQAGAIPVIEPSQRAQRARTWPLTLPRKAIEQGATTPAEIMALAPGVSYQAAWRALSRARAISSAANKLPDTAAAATDSLSVDKARVITYQVSAERPPAGYYAPADAIELACPACTLEYRDGAFRHERSCLFRRARTAG
jgi:hypothetical protein